MFIGISNVISGIRTAGLSYIKDNLKLYLDFKSNRSDTLAFPSEGSTSFDGNDYISIGALGNLGTDCTVTFWINRTNSTGNQFVWDARGASNGGTGYAYFSNGGNYLNIGGGGTTYVDGVQTNTIAVGGWYFVAITGQTLNVNEDFQIARRLNNIEFFNGKLANIGVWSRTLSLEEINSVMNKSYSQLGSVEKTSLVSWWALDSVSGLGIQDEHNTETLGSELVGSGFYTLSNWTSSNTESNPTATSVKFVRGSDNSGGYIYLRSEDNQLTTNLTVGTIYKITFTYTTDDGDAYPVIKDSSNTYYSFGSTSGEKVLYYKAVHATFDRIMFQGVSAGTFVQIADVSIKEVTSDNIGIVTGATTTSSVYGGNAPILPRAIDIAESQAEAIGNGSADFSGSDSDYIALSDRIILKGDFSITGWAYRANAASDMIMSDSTGSETLNYIWITDATKIGIDSPATGWTHLQFNATFDHSEWHHFAITRTAKVFKVYINGTLSDTADKSSDSGYDADWSFNQFGRYATGISYAWGGKLAHIGAFQGALTQSQVQEIYESTSYAKIPASVKSTLGSELVTSITNSSSNPWETFSGASGNTLASATNDAGTSGEMFSQQLGLSVDTLVKVTVTVTLNAGTIKAQFCASDGSYTSGDLNEIITSSGTHSFYAIISHVSKDQLWIKHQTSPLDISNLTLSVKEVTNDIVAYYPLDADSSANGVTQDVTTGEVLGTEVNTLANALSPTNEADATTGLTSSDSNITSVSSPAYSGSYSIKFETDGNGEAMSFNPNLTLENGKLYKLSITYKTDSVNDEMRFKLGTGNNSGTYVDAYPIPGSTDWVTLDYYFLTSSTTFDMTIIESVSSPSEITAYIDNISIKKVTSNTGVLK